MCISTAQLPMYEHLYMMQLAGTVPIGSCVKQFRSTQTSANRRKDEASILDLLNSRTTNSGLALDVQLRPAMRVVRIVKAMKRC